jgi:hypothetical protein
MQPIPYSTLILTISQNYNKDPTTIKKLLFHLSSCYPDEFTDFMETYYTQCLR